MRWNTRAPWAVGIMWGTLASSLSAQGQGTYREQLHPNALGGVIVSIDPIRQSNDVPMPAAVQLRERLGALFAVAGMEAVGAETPYALTSFVAAQPSREEDSPVSRASDVAATTPSPNGFERRVSTLVDITLQLIYRPTGEIMGEWTFVVPGTGRDRPDAVDNAFRQVRPNTTRYVEVAREVRERVVRHAEASCEALRTRAGERAKQGAFDLAVAELLLVPDEARGCHTATLDDVSALLATRFRDPPASGTNDGGRAMQRAVQLQRDPIRNEWPFTEGSRLTVAFVNANGKASRRGEKIW